MSENKPFPTPTERLTCVRCGHSGSLYDGEVCNKSTGHMKNCGCTCEFPTEAPASVEAPERIWIVADRDGPYSEFMYPFKAQANDIGYTRNDLVLQVGSQQLPPEKDDQQA